MCSEFRAGRYLGILVIPGYWNQTIATYVYCVNFSESGFIVFENSFEARRLVMAILLKTKAQYLQNQINDKIP